MLCLLGKQLKNALKAYIICHDGEPAKKRGVI